MADIQVPDRDGRLARNEKYERQIQGGREAREARLRAEKPVQTSTNPLPIQKGLKQASSVSDVFKKC